MKTSAAVALFVLFPLVGCDRADQAPQDSHSGKAPTGMIDPGPNAPSRERASSPEPTTGAAGTAGMAGSATGAGGNGGSGGSGGGAGVSGGTSGSGGGAG